MGTWFCPLAVDWIVVGRSECKLLVDCKKALPWRSSAFVTREKSVVSLRGLR